MLRNIFCWKGFGPVTGPPSFPGANFQQMVIARLSLGLSFLGLRNFLKLCHDEKPCTWWLGEKGLGSLQSRLARMLHHEYDALKGYRFLGGAISFYSVSCMSDVIFNPSLLNWSSLILTVPIFLPGTGIESKFDRCFMHLIAIQTFLPANIEGYPMALPFPTLDLAEPVQFLFWSLRFPTTHSKTG